MDVIGGVIARLDSRAPVWADRLRWRRERRADVALRAVDLLVSRNDVVLDIGAEKGRFSSRMLDLVGPGGAVLAFEPNPAHHQRLGALAAGRPLEVHAAALSDHPGESVLQIPVVDGRPYVGWASLEDRGLGAVQMIPVPVLTLDDVCGSERPVSFIKCDVEGHEDAVLRGARELLARDHPSVLIEIEHRHRQTAVSGAFGFFADLGYEGWAACRSGLRPLASFDLQRDQLAFLSGATTREVMPNGYVHNFVFVAPGTDMTRLADQTVLDSAPLDGSPSSISA